MNLRLNCSAPSNFSFSTTYFWFSNGISPVEFWSNSANNILRCHAFCTFHLADKTRSTNLLGVVECSKLKHRSRGSYLDPCWCSWNIGKYSSYCRTVAHRKPMQIEGIPNNKWKSVTNWEISIIPLNLQVTRHPHSLITLAVILFFRCCNRTCVLLNQTNDNSHNCLTKILPSSSSCYPSIHFLIS